MTVPRAASILLALAALVLAPAPSRAQADLPVGGDGPSLHVELTKAFFDDPGPFGGSRRVSSLWDATVAVPLASGPTLFARLALSFGAIDGLASSATVSKPRLGSAISPTAGLDVEAHVDLPVMVEMGSLDYATPMGTFSDYEELERFQKDMWSFGASTTATTELDPGAFVGTRVGATLLVPTGGGRDTDLFAIYSVFGHVPAGSSRLRFELSGIALVTEEGPSFSQRTWFFGSVVLSRPGVRFAPEFYLRVPVDEGLEGTVNFMAGIRLHMGG